MPVFEFRRKYKITFSVKHPSSGKWQGFAVVCFDKAGQQARFNGYFAVEKKNMNSMQNAAERSKKIVSS
jgi:hypothetical protein